MVKFSLEEYLKDPSRKVVTRDGRNVRIICTDRRGLNVKPITALITIPNGDEIIKTYWENGVETQGYEDNPNDLFFASEKKEGWINIYKDDDIFYASMNIFKTKKEAEDASCNTCIATVKIEWKE